MSGWPWGVLAPPGVGSTDSKIEAIVAPLFTAPARAGAVVCCFGGAHDLSGGLLLARFFSLDFFEVGGSVRQIGQIYEVVKSDRILYSARMFS